MLTKAQVKDIRSLAQHKSRKEQGAYIIEGDKMAKEWLAAGAGIRHIIATETWLAQHAEWTRGHADALITAVKEQDLERISQLETPNKVVLVATLPPAEEPPALKEWCLVLDKIQDPGNMGTIIRIADWYGIRHIVASPDSVDFYNHKVLQSAMGGHLRVNLYTAPLPSFLQQLNIPVIAATLDGVNVYESQSPKAAALLIGNESKGLSPEVQQLATQKIMIPRRGGAESLNAAVATGILCALLLPH